MIAVETNLLVYAHRRDSPWHQASTSLIRQLAEGRTAWSIPWPCVHEFLAIVTHPRIYRPASTVAQALDQVDAWLESPGLVMLAEASGHGEGLRSVLEGARVVGAQVHDARIFAICLAAGVSELWTADRDFNRFSGLTVKNPLVGR